MVNVVILRRAAKIYVQWSTSTSKRRRKMSRPMERATKNWMLSLKRNFRSSLKARKGGKQKKSTSLKWRFLVMKAKKYVSSLAEFVENEEISSSSSEWKIGSDEIFVTCLNDNGESKINPIKNNLDLFINTSLNHMSIRSCLVSQPKNKLISNSEQLFNATDLLPITFSVILPPIYAEKFQQILKIVRALRMGIGILKRVLSEYR